MSGGVRYVYVEYDTGRLMINQKVICNLRVTSPANIPYYLNNSYANLNTLELVDAMKCVAEFYQRFAEEMKSSMNKLFY